MAYMLREQATSRNVPWRKNVLAVFLSHQDCFLPQSSVCLCMSCVFPSVCPSVCVCVCPGALLVVLCVAVMCDSDYITQPCF